eukprot:jgi/Botrbrau1/16564/Bobra.0262s0002.1
MANHTTYKRPEGETTQWDDIQVKYGNKAPPEQVSKAEPFAPRVEGVTKDGEWLQQQSEAELEDLEDDFMDDPILEKIRKDRLEELKAQQAQKSTGGLKKISVDNFVQEVTKGSKDCTVVLYLYKDKMVLPPTLLVYKLAQCAEVAASLDQLSKEYPGTKFLKMISTECIPKYPDTSLPTILVYRSKKVALTLAGTDGFG